MIGRSDKGTSPAPEAELNRSLGRLTALGAVLVVAGLVGLVYVGVATLTSVLLFGWLLLVGGVVALLHAVQSRRSHYFWLGLIVGALYVAAGVVVVRFPGTSAEGLTLFAALLFLTGGVFRLVGGAVARGQQMVWTLVQGVFGILLGVLVLADWPESSLYVLGSFFSLALLFDGLGLVASGMGGRQLVGMVAEERDRAEQQRTAGVRPDGRASGGGDARRGDGEGRGSEQKQSKDKHFGQ